MASKMIKYERKMREHDCKDAGGTQPRMAVVDSVWNKLSRPRLEQVVDDCKDAGGTQPRMAVVDSVWNKLSRPRLEQVVEDAVAEEWSL